MDENPLESSRKYILQHGTINVLAKIDGIEAVISTDFSGEKNNVNHLILNEIGKVNIKLSKPLFYDTFAENKSNGAFILIDSQTNNTAGVGFIN